MGSKHKYCTVCIYAWIYNNVKIQFKWTLHVHSTVAAAISLTEQNRRTRISIQSTICCGEPFSSTSANCGRQPLGRAVNHRGRGYWVEGLRIDQARLARGRANWVSCQNFTESSGVRVVTFRRHSLRKYTSNIHPIYGNESGGSIRLPRSRTIHLEQPCSFTHGSKLRRGVLLHRSEWQWPEGCGCRYRNRP